MTTPNDERTLGVIRAAGLGEYDDSNHFTPLSNVPEKLRPLVSAVAAACLIGRMAEYLDEPEKHAAVVLHWKRSAVEEIDHEVSMLADRDYAAYCREAMNVAGAQR